MHSARHDGRARAVTDGRDAIGRTALFHAAMHGHCGAIRALWEAGARVDLRDNFECDALHWAAEYCKDSAHALLSDLKSPLLPLAPPELRALLLRALVEPPSPPPPSSACPACPTPALPHRSERLRGVGLRQRGGSRTRTATRGA